VDRFTKYKVIIAILAVVVVTEAILIVSLRQKKKIEKPHVFIKGRIAIVLDDWGYNLNNLGILDEIKYPLNISVLPNLNYSQEVAEKAKANGIELILHLPLEPKPNEYVRLEQDTIMTRMEPVQIKEILLKGLDSLPSIKGVSNHMGSKATSDLKTMQAIFEELKKGGLYFLDSVVIPNSVCASLSSRMSLKFIKRDIFLDNEADPEYIRAQLEKLKARALRKGKAVGIGHDRRLTLQVLKREMPRLEKEGFKFVFVTELLN
jgi:polysaccharide deacetylase 2 family uncharacterized protein YibQ